MSFYRAVLGWVWLPRGVLQSRNPLNRPFVSLKVSVCGGSQGSCVDAPAVGKFKGEVMRDLECDVQWSVLKPQLG